jgi:hypothetical protein
VKGTENGQWASPIGRLPARLGVDGEGLLGPPRSNFGAAQVTLWANHSGIGSTTLK